MTEVLKPCPHCGGQAKLIWPANGPRPYVMCAVNFCTGPKDTEAEAIAAWNRRADPPMTPHDRAMFKKTAKGQR